MRHDHLPYAGSPWSVDTDIDWTQLELGAVPSPLRRYMADLYGHILAAETLGLKMVLRLVDKSAEGPLRDVARVQLEDEERHVAFFRRVISRLGGEEARSTSLLTLEQELAEANDYVSIMTLTQVMENAANALFNGHAREALQALQGRVRLPGSSAVQVLLHHLSGKIGRDEGQHVALGMRILRLQYKGMTARARHVLEGRVQSSAALMLSACSETAESYRRLGFDPAALRDRIALAQARYWRHLDIDVQGGACTGGDP